jgi:hypothetical protein
VLDDAGLLDDVEAGDTAVGDAAVGDVQGVQWGPVGPRKTGRDLDSYLGYPAGPRPVPNRYRLLKPPFYVF